MHPLDCFKAYDIRGKLGKDFNEDVAYRIGRAYAEVIKPKNVVVGADVRLSSESIKQSLSDGLRCSGVNVIDLGMVGTEQVYFATSFLKACGGIEVTASHNPIDYNGMKLVREESKPISSDSGLLEIKKLTERNKFSSVNVKRGHYQKADLLDEYLSHLLTYIDLRKVEPFKLVVNSGNGCAGPVVDAFESHFFENEIPIDFIKVNNCPDGTFPNGIPNPLLKENRHSTIENILKNDASMGVAWDGDFDRCFLFDEKGRFIEGYYIVGLLARAFLERAPGSKIIHDPRLVWNTREIVNKHNGIPVQCRTGHAFLKEKMRAEGAIYGGEMSAHHYFKDFFYCDSGMIPWLLIIDLMSGSGQSLSQLVDEMIINYPSPGEINFTVENAEASIDAVEKYFRSSALSVDYTDGIAMEFETWRFNLRMSNTEPLVRLNIETRSDEALIDKYVKKFAQLLS